MAITIKVPEDYLRAINLADLIIYSVKNTMKFGSGNQAASNIPAKLAVGDRTFKKTKYPGVHLTWEASELYDRGALVAPNKNKPADSQDLMRRAYLSTYTKSGNCGAMANLAYVLCREYFGREWTVTRASSNYADHGFVLISRNGGELISIDIGGREYKVGGIIVVDPWPIYPQAMLWTLHFCAPPTPRKNWKNDGSFMTFSEKRALGASTPSDASIQKMVLLIEQLREGSRLEKTMDAEDVLVSSRIEKYSVDKGIARDIRQETLREIDNEGKPKQYNMLYASKLKEFFKFEVIAKKTVQVEDRRNRSLKRTLSDMYSQ